MVILPVLGRVISRMARMDRRVRLAGILAAENKREGEGGTQPTWNKDTRDFLFYTRLRRLAGRFVNSKLP